MPTLATLLRPQSLDTIHGQSHLLDPGMPIRKMADTGKLYSTILWGPSGTGKTSMVRALAKTAQFTYRPLNATENSISDFRKILETADEDEQILVFIDEIGRWNKGQLDTLLPSIEDGRIVMFGATTDNPKFAVTATVLSRCLVFETKPLTVKAQMAILANVIAYLKSINIALKADAKVVSKIISRANGDARKFLNVLDMLVNMAEDGVITDAMVDAVIPHRHMLVNKGGGHEFDSAHAFQTAIQHSDVNSAIYWLAQWIASGEDPAYICRRMLVTAFEDCASNPLAGVVAMAAHYTVERIGLPEAMIPMSLATCMMAESSRDKSAYNAIHAAIRDVEHGEFTPVPEVMRAVRHAAGTSEYLGINRKYVHRPDPPHSI